MIGQARVEIMGIASLSPSQRAGEASWHKVKAQIFDMGFPSIAACARQLNCTTEALRQTTKGKCPGVRTKLEALLR